MLLLCTRGQTHGLQQMATEASRHSLTTVGPTGHRGAPGNTSDTGRSSGKHVHYLI